MIFERDDGNINTGVRISPDDCFNLLSNHRRRYLLHYLKQNGESATLGELAQQIAAWENGICKEGVTYEQRKRVYTSLQQVHLPRMDEMDVVEFDDQAGIVRTGPVASELDVYMEIVRRDQIPWSVFYFGLALLNLGAVGVVSVGGPVIDFFGGIEFAVFCTTTFLIASLAHVYINRVEMRLGDSSKPPELAD